VKAQVLSRFERACLAHRLQEEVEQSMIGICLANQAHLRNLRVEGSPELSNAQRIQELLVQNIRTLAELIRMLDNGKPR